MSEENRSRGKSVRSINLKLDFSSADSMKKEQLFDEVAKHQTPATEKTQEIKDFKSQNQIKDQPLPQSQPDSPSAQENQIKTGSDGTKEHPQ